MLVLIIIPWISPTEIPAHNDTITGDITTGFPESSSHTLAGALANAAVEPSTGVFQASLPLNFPKARGEAQPGLSINYSSASGTRELGEGWGFSLPVIERRNISGGPRYVASGWESYQTDQFQFMGAKLIPICKISEENICRTSDEPLPAWVRPGMVYFRLENDASHIRFFLWPNGFTWRLQYTNGEIIELGVARVPPFETRDDQGLDFDTVFGKTLPNAGIQVADVTQHIYRWNIVRRYDAFYGSQPRNVVVYQWGKRDITGRGYLTDVYYSPGTFSLDHDTPTIPSFAHHLRLEWIQRPTNVTATPTPIWRSRPSLMLSEISVTTKQWTDPKGQRELLRRYYFGYSQTNVFFPPYPRISSNSRLQPHLLEFRVEGRCAQPIFEENEILPKTSCPLLPTTKFRYSTTNILNTNDIVTSPDRNVIPVSLLHAVPRLLLTAPTYRSTSYETAKDLTLSHWMPLDINSDSLPDLIEIGRCPSYKAWETPPECEATAGTPDQRVYWSGDRSGATFSALQDPNNQLFTNKGYTVTGDLLGNGAFSAMFLVPWKGDAPGIGPVFSQLKETHISSPSSFVWEPPSGFSSGYTSTTGGFIPFPGNYPDKIQLIGDIDGDGLPDSLNWASEGANEPYFQKRFGEAQGFFSADWKHKGAFHIRLSSRLKVNPGDSSSCCNSPFGLDVDSALVPAVESIEQASYGWEEGNQKRLAVFLADMNGDSLADLVTVGPAPSVSGASLITYWPSDGKGNFTACKGSGCTTAWAGAKTPSYTMAIPKSVASNTALDGRHIRVGDVTGDGLADVVFWDRNGIHVFVNWDGTFGEEYLIPQNYLMPFKLIDQHGDIFTSDWWFTDPHLIDIALADMNGNGLNDLLIFLRVDSPPIRTGHPERDNPFRDQVWAIDLHFNDRYAGPQDQPDGFAPRPGLLTEVSNELGASTTITYRSTADLYRASQRAGTPWKHPLPQVLMVAERITTRTNLPDPYQSRKQIGYSFNDPVWDGWERRFLGFREVTVKRWDPLGNNAEAIWTHNKFFIPECPNGFCNELPSAYRSASGALVATELYDADGHYLSTSARSYKILQTARGLNGQSSWFSYPQKIDTVLYDLREWNPISTALEAKIEETHTVWEGGIPIRSASYALLRQTQERDKHGRVFISTNHGRIKEDGTAIDPPILTRIMHSALRPDWKSLIQSTHTDPFTYPSEAKVPQDLPRETRFTYDQRGRLTTVSAALTGTISLQRSHEDPLQAVAPSPPHASRDRMVRMLRLEYDDYDNVIIKQGSNDLCEKTIFDEDFHELPIQHIRYGGVTLNETTIDEAFGSQTCALLTILNQSRPAEYRTQLKWDRGLQVVVEQQSPQGALNQTIYDGFGRIEELRTPHPKVGDNEAVPTLRVKYQQHLVGQLLQIEHRISDDTWHQSWRYIDGLGNNLLSLDQTDLAGGAGRQWRASGLSLRDTQGKVRRVYTPWFYSGDPKTHSVTPPTGPYRDIARDRFGRVLQLQRHNGDILGRFQYGSLSVDLIEGDRRRTTVETDGFGRPIVSRRHTPDGEIISKTYFHVLGEPTLLTRFNSSDPTKVITRWMQYDSLGRMVLNVEPNTSVHFSPDPSEISELRSWRYAYNDSGKLVGTSDARGCGKNLFYDRLGRLLAEDYSPCLKSHATYTPLNLGPTNDPADPRPERASLEISYGSGAEVWYRYDVPERGQTDHYGVNTSNLKGRLVSRGDRSGHTRFGYDYKGNLITQAMQLARPDTEPTALATEWFETNAEFDLAGSLTQMTTGAKAQELLGVDGQSDLVPKYGIDGQLSGMHSSYGKLISLIERNAAGNPRIIQYSDAALTTSIFDYDEANRLTSLQLKQVGSRPPLEIEHLAFTYSPGDLLSSVADHRSDGTWQPGTKPSTRSYTYDRLRRVTSVKTEYCCGGDDIVLNGFIDGALPPSRSDHRVLNQTFNYDWQGNTITSTDDSNTFFDRSLGTITNGSESLFPNQLISAGENKLRAYYDSSGNLQDLTLSRATCADTEERCTHRLIFDWDEVGNLARVRRWNYREMPSSVQQHPNLPSDQPGIDVRFLYNAGGERVIKTIMTASEARHSVQVFPTLRLENAGLDSSGNYERTAQTEVIVIPGFGQILFRRDASDVGGTQHVLMEFGDHLGSVGTVVDKSTGEILQRRIFLPYGGVDSDYRAYGWENLSLGRGFTGKEHDAELGLIYFGARYYMPGLGRWISADPLTIHGLGSDPNPYAYVSGKVSDTIDPLGLCEGSLGFEMCPGGQLGSGGGISISIPLPDLFGSGKNSSGPPGPSIAPVKKPPPPAPAPSNSGNISSGSNLSGIQNWVLNGSGPIHDFLTDDKALQNLQSTIWNLTLGTELALATAGLGAIAAEAISAVSSATLYMNTVRMSAAINEMLAAQSGLAIGGTGAGAVASTAIVKGTSTAMVKWSYWPDNRGFFGATLWRTLTPGTLLSRYGARTGTFVSPVGVPFPMRGLPPNPSTPELYRVIQPIQVRSGFATPWFGQPGLGPQFELQLPVERYIQQLMLEVVVP